MRIVDLRSDTVTHPTPAMRQAMYEAEVGDDVYREDPTVIKLEQMAAELTGKEAGLFLASGTMGNQVAIMTHTKKGDEVICEAEAHVYYYEAGAIACLSGVQPHPIKGEQGILNAGSIIKAIRSKNVHFPDTGLICLENTHNRAGGTCYSLSELQAIGKVAADYAIPIHMDGARLFNAAIALGIPARDITAHVHSVQFCLSKGLGAPVGSVLTGSEEFIERARRFRKMLGGGMRQAGVLAAAGIVALTTMRNRLADDHRHARILAEGLAELGLGIDLPTVETNIVVCDVVRTGQTARDFAGCLGTAGVIVNEFGEGKIRLVTHYGISRQDIDYALTQTAQILKR